MSKNRITYTLGQAAVRTGLGGLSMKTTGVLFGGMIVFIISSMSGFTGFGFLVVLPVTALSAGVTYLKFGGRNLAELGQIALQDMERKRKGEDKYASGGLSMIPDGEHRLPGLLASTRLVEAVDLQGREFAVIVDDNYAEVTIVLDAQLSGQATVTQDERDGLTAAWGGWLASLSLPGDIRSASITVSTHPSSGELLSEEVNRLVVSDAPALAQKIMREAAQELSAGLPEISTHIAITLKIPREHLKDDIFLESLVTRVSGFSDPLAWAGIQAAPMNTDQLVARIHSAYNPASESDFEQLSVRGHAHGLTWDNAGPQAAQAHRTHYDHDGVTSRTWEMTKPPQANFEDRILTRLLAPHPRIHRKRVTLWYRPYEAGVGARRVEAEHIDALNAASSSRKTSSARASVRVEQTEASRRAQARGAQLGRYSLFVTATVEKEEELPAVSQDIAQLAATSSIRLKTVTRQQDMAFSACLGVGSAPWTRSSLLQGPQLLLPVLGDN